MFHSLYVLGPCAIHQLIQMSPCLNPKDEQMTRYTREFILVASLIVMYSLMSCITIDETRTQK